MKDELHRLRVDLARSRQQEICDVLDECEAVLAKRGLAHPYELDIDGYEELMSVSGFASPGNGPTATSPDCAHLYRISTAAKVHRNVAQWKPRASIRRDSDLIPLLKRAERHTKDRWVPLKELATGTLACKHRTITWWTSLDEYEDPIRFANRVGILGRWVVPNTIMLRADCAFLREHNVLRVPNEIDAYASAIFHPTNHSDDPPMSGVTIDLTATPLDRGVPEFVAHEISVEAIHLKLVHAPTEDRGIQFVSPELQGDLCNYYLSLK